MKIVKTEGRFESFFHPFEPYEYWLGEKFQNTEYEIEMAMISDFLEEWYPERHQEVAWINKLDCPICGKGIMGECDWGEDSADVKFIALTSVGCAKCAYMVADKEAVEVLFGNKLSDEQKEKMSLQSIAIVDDNKYFDAGYY